MSLSTSRRCPDCRAAGESSTCTRSAISPRRSGCSTPWSTNTYVGDCVAATAAAIECGRDGEAYNIGGGTVMTVLEAIELIAGTMNVEARIRFEPARVG